MEKVQRAAIPSAAKPALLPLEPRYDQTATYRHPKDWMAEHRVGVFNPPGQPERKAHMYLIKMEPLPRNIPDLRWAPDFPYTVPPLSGGSPDAGLLIRPGQEELWNIGTTGTGIDGHMNAGAFTGGIRFGLPWRFDPDERWRLS